MGTGSFPGVKSSLSVTLTPHPLLVLWSRKSRAIPLLSLWAIRPVQSLSACTRVHFTFLRTEWDKAVFVAALQECECTWKLLCTFVQRVAAFVENTDTSCVI